MLTDNPGTKHNFDKLLVQNTQSSASCFRICSSFRDWVPLTSGLVSAPVCISVSWKGLAQKSACWQYNAHRQLRIASIQIRIAGSLLQFQPCDGWQSGVQVN